MGKRIGFLSTRFEGTDGVTLEAGKWADVFEENGHAVFWFAGRLDKDPSRSFLVPEAFFHHPDNTWINERIVGRAGRDPGVTEKVAEIKSFLRSKIGEFIEQFEIELLVVENALSLPMHVPLGVALTELLAESLIPCIAHHHDFHWERTRFSVHAMGDYLRMSFPPSLPNVVHVVINTVAQEELALRTGLSSSIIPNILDFEHPPEDPIPYLEDIRKTLDLDDADKIILQPTRVIQRKGIEHAIDLVRRLNNPMYKLVISHETGDEGFEYAEWLKEDAASQGVDLRFVPLRVNDRWHKQNADPPDKLTLWDVYPQADFITYPSLYEGFGNAFLEAIYFKKPMLINRYATFIKDIEPLGFDLIVMDGFLTKRNIEQVKEVLVDIDRREKMVNHNYSIAKRRYSYSVLEKKINSIMEDIFGMDV